MLINQNKDKYIRNRRGPSCWVSFVSQTTLQEKFTRYLHSDGQVNLNPYQYMYIYTMPVLLSIEKRSKERLKQRATTCLPLMPVEWQQEW